jgi:hypothetical protein
MLGWEGPRVHPENRNFFQVQEIFIRRNDSKQVIVVQRHGGCIWVESEQGKVATFYFTLPIRPGKANAQSLRSDPWISKRTKHRDMQHDA